MCAASVCRLGESPFFHVPHARWPFRRSCATSWAALCGASWPRSVPAAAVRRYPGIPPTHGPHPHPLTHGQRVGHKTFFVCAGVIQAAALGLMALCIHANSFPGWIVCFLTVGTIYGGCHGVIPVFLNQMFGPKIVGALHGTILFVWAVSDIIGTVRGGLG